MPDQEIHIKDESLPRHSLCGKTPQFMVSIQFVEETTCWLCQARSKELEDTA